MTNTLSPHLQDLENESIHILREVAGQFDKVGLLFSGGKDSCVVFELARRAFAPQTVPFELVHIDTGHNFPEVIQFRDELVQETGARLHVAKVQDWIDRGDLQERPDGTRNPLQSVPLVETIAERGYDAVLGGARRDEERARAKERIFSVRDSFGGWDPRRQRPELWDLYNGGKLAGENIRVFPISNWTEADIWEYIGARELRLPDIYYSHKRELFNRNGMWLSPGDWAGQRTARPWNSRPCATAPWATCLARVLWNPLLPPRMKSWQRFLSPRCQSAAQRVPMTSYPNLPWKTARRKAISDELGGNTKNPRNPAPVHRRQR